LIPAPHPQHRLLVATVLLTLIGAAPAAACPRTASRGLHDRLVASDAAFVGKRVKPGVYRVQVRVRGELGRRVRVRGVRGCGVPKRAGLLLDRRKGRWWATVAVAPSELFKASGIGP
jgi:hypothetical protein